MREGLFTLRGAKSSQTSRKELKQEVVVVYRSIIFAVGGGENPLNLLIASGVISPSLSLCLSPFLTTPWAIQIYCLLRGGGSRGTRRGGRARGKVLSLPSTRLALRSHRFICLFLNFTLRQTFFYNSARTVACVWCEVYNTVVLVGTSQLLILLLQKLFFF